MPISYKYREQYVVSDGTQTCFFPPNRIESNSKSWTVFFFFVKTGPDGCLSRYFNLLQSICFFSQLLLLLTRKVGKSVVRFPEWVDPLSWRYPNKKKRFSNDAFWFLQDCVISNNSIKYNSIVVSSGKFGGNWDILGVWMLFAGNYWKWHNRQEFHKASGEKRGFFFIWAPLEWLVGGTHSDKRTTNFRRSG